MRIHSHITCNQKLDFASRENGWVGSRQYKQAICKLTKRFDKLYTNSTILIVYHPKTSVKENIQSILEIRCINNQNKKCVLDKIYIKVY
jgi:hypothetical protein